MISESIVVVDIETEVLGERPDPETDVLKFVGFRDKHGNRRRFHADERGSIQWGLTGKWKFIVGHNFKEYDAVVLKRHGFVIHPSIIIDTLEIMQKRAKQMMNLDFSQGQLGLAYLGEYFGLEVQKGEIDYDIFKQDSWTDSELEEIDIYLFGDLDTTFYLFEYLYKFFIGFKEFVAEKDVERMSWLTTSPGTVAYKAVCNMAGIDEEYDDVEEDETGIQYQGAFVALPEVDSAEGDIYCADFSSLYPHMFMGGNLYSPEDGGWHGSGVFKSVEDNPEDGISGYYSSERGKIEQTIKDLYDLRVSIRKTMEDMVEGSQEWVTADTRQYATKIILNTIYGISGSAIFKSVFNLTTAADCTAMARMAIKQAREYLTDKGFNCLYTDTDSVYFSDPFKNGAYVEHVCSEITNMQRKSFNIDVDSHDFEIEAKIKRIYFFKNDKDEYVKKLYAYVKDNDKITLKGIQLVKGTCSTLSKSIYEAQIKPLMLSGSLTILKRDTIEKWVRETISVGNVSKRFRVNSLESYKSASSIQAQIATRYGAGEHYLIPNTVTGAGKGVKYATIEELEAMGDPLDFIDIRKHVGELKHFIAPIERKMIDHIGMGHVCKSFSVTDESEKDRLAQHVVCRTCAKKYVRVKFKKSTKWSYYDDVDG